MCVENNSLPYDQTFSENNCFLCGRNITEQCSVEHIFPKWLLQEFNLWNNMLNLLNGSSIQYRYLIVPCCQECNNKYLSMVEKRVHQYLKEGFDKFKYLDEPIVFQWLGKIYYGLLYKELTLLSDRTNPNLGSINNQRFLENFQGLHSLLQSARYPTNYEFHYPWSIFLVKVKPFGDERDFDYYDDSDRGAIKIRIKDVGIIACLLDTGEIKNVLGDLFQNVNNKVLHPIQFEELASIVFYQNLLLNRTPKFVNIIDSADDPQLTIVPLPIGGYSLKPIYKGWSMNDYSSILASFLEKYGYSRSDLINSENEVASFTFNDDGSFKNIV